MRTLHVPKGALTHYVCRALMHLKMHELVTHTDMGG